MSAPATGHGHAPPAPGAAIEVAEGVLWAALPLPIAALGSANVFALDDGANGWTLVDTGMNWARGTAALDALLAGPLGGRPVHRVILTHHHPDHVGRAGPLAEAGAEVLASRTAWLMARMLTLDVQPAATPEQIRFRNRAGLTGAALAAYAAERPFNFADVVAPIPLGFRTLAEGDRLTAGGREWIVRLGQGHAPDHVTLWSDDGALLVSGDQVLPGVSPNIGVYPTEPEADPLGGWLESCRRFAALDADPLVLPGHRLPFRGLGLRLEALIENHVHALDRIMAAVDREPRRAVELFPALYRREIAGDDVGLALVETVAHLNRLLAEGRVRRRLDGEGCWLWEPAR